MILPLLFVVGSVFAADPNHFHEIEKCMLDNNWELNTPGGQVDCEAHARFRLCAEILGYGNSQMVHDKCAQANRVGCSIPCKYQKCEIDTCLMASGFADGSFLMDPCTETHHYLMCAQATNCAGTPQVQDQCDFAKSAGCKNVACDAKPESCETSIHACLEKRGINPSDAVKSCTGISHYMDCAEEEGCSQDRGLQANCNAMAPLCPDLDCATSTAPKDGKQCNKDIHNCLQKNHFNADINSCGGIDHYMKCAEQVNCGHDGRVKASCLAMQIICPEVKCEKDEETCVDKVNSCMQAEGLATTGRTCSYMTAYMKCADKADCIEDPSIHAECNAFTVTCPQLACKVATKPNEPNIPRDIDPKPKPQPAKQPQHEKPATKYTCKQLVGECLSQRGVTNDGSCDFQVDLFKCQRDTKCFLKVECDALKYLCPQLDCHEESTPSKEIGVNVVTCDDLLEKCLKAHGATNDWDCVNSRHQVLCAKTTGCDPRAASQRCMQITSTCPTPIDCTLPGHKPEVINCESTMEECMRVRGFHANKDTADCDYTQAHVDCLRDTCHRTKAVTTQCNALQVLCPMLDCTTKKAVPPSIVPPKPASKPETCDGQVKKCMVGHGWATDVNDYKNKDCSYFENYHTCANKVGCVQDSSIRHACEAMRVICPLLDCDVKDTPQPVKRVKPVVKPSTATTCDVKSCLKKHSWDTGLDSCAYTQKSLECAEELGCRDHQNMQDICDLFSPMCPLLQCKKPTPKTTLPEQPHSPCGIDECITLHGKGLDMSDACAYTTLYMQCAVVDMCTDVFVYQWCTSMAPLCNDLHCDAFAPAVEPAKPHKTVGDLPLPFPVSNSGDKATTKSGTSCDVRTCMQNNGWLHTKTNDCTYLQHQIECEIMCGNTKEASQQCQLMKLHACPDMDCAALKAKKWETHCAYQGKFYAVGRTFLSNDGCNTCFCKPGTVVSCTDNICQKKPETDGFEVPIGAVDRVMNDTTKCYAKCRQGGYSALGDVEAACLIGCQYRVSTAHKNPQEADSDCKAKCHSKYESRCDGPHGASCCAGCAHKDISCFDKCDIGGCMHVHGFVSYKEGDGTPSSCAAAAQYFQCAVFTDCYSMVKQSECNALSLSGCDKVDCNNAGVNNYRPTSNTTDGIAPYPSVFSWTWWKYNVGTKYTIMGAITLAVLLLLTFICCCCTDKKSRRATPQSRAGPQRPNFPLAIPMKNKADPLGYSLLESPTKPRGKEGWGSLI